MKFGAHRRQPHDVHVGPARSIALLLAGLLMVCVIALFRSGMNPLATGVFAGMGVALGLRGIYRLLVPGLVLRFVDQGAQYQWRERSWCSTIRSPFVSPWFIGWRGQGLLGFGIFPSQLSKDEFRRLAKALRQGRSGGME